MGKKTPDAEYKRQRKALADTYEDASEAVNAILFSREAQEITLSFGGVLYDGGSLRKLSLLIANQRVLAFVVGNTTDLPPGSEAKYLQDIDAILLRHQPTDAYTKSAVIHECIHAINDMNKLDITSADNEKYAYIFQALYLRNLNFAGNIIGAGGTRDIRFPPAAFNIADSIRNRRSVSLDDVTHLQATLQSNIEYKNIKAKSPDDGIRK
ncbi:MAG: hypothetical protein ABI356_12355 [Steroidobacteraceae bacterium]